MTLIQLPMQVYFCT